MTNYTDISIVLAGAAGQGIQTIEEALTRILKKSGFNVFATKEYMSRVRGGSNSTTIRVSSKKIDAIIDKIDFLIPLDKNSLEHVSSRIGENTLILGEKEITGELNNLVEVPFTQIANEVGNKIFSNTVAIGVISGMLGCEKNFITDYLEKRFSNKGKDIIDKNIEASQKGYELGVQILKEKGLVISIEKSSSIEQDLMINGAQAVGLGAIAGGCNFISTYPMSPSTGVLVFLAQHEHDFDIIVEQAEDEISAINMSIGAWYAGARALVSTSGGGFALMGEGISLSGMIETPTVVHVAQRPGPATGLPTRTGQEDLELVLYAGHGEFPRIIFAPGSIEQAYDLTKKAFNMADKYQSPVFVLTDQYLVDSYYNVEKKIFKQTTIDNHIVKTDETYQRYAITNDGFSPRGIPGFGDGLVCVDSDEHDETGHITESMEIRNQMVEKRLKKMDAIIQSIEEPELIGTTEYETLVVCWGSTRNVVKETVETIGGNVSALHFSQVYPVHPNTKKLLQKAKQVLLVEMNATGQFGKLIQLSTGINIEKKILKYDGLQLSVEELTDKIRGVLNE